MLLKKEGFPEEDELVLCTVTKIFPHSVFVELDEYKRAGMIHISEVSPGRIRNIRDFVKEGKKVVCKVLRVNKEKGYIDLSLRRVNERQKKHKINEIKQEQKAEKIIEILAKDLNKNPEELYKDISSKILKSYHMIYLCFEDVVKRKVSLEKFGIDKDVAKVLASLIDGRMKPPEVSVRGELILKTYAPNGIEVVKESLERLEKKGKGNVRVVYEGGGKYMVESRAEDYKEAETILTKSVNFAIDFMKKNDGVAEFIRDER